MTTTTKERTPLLVENTGLRIGEMNHAVDGHDNASLFVAYLDFLAELRSASPSVGSLRTTDIEVLAQVTGLTHDHVRWQLQRFLTAQRPKRLTRRARAGVFATFGVAILGGALALASVISASAADGTTTEAKPRLEIGFGSVIDRSETPPPTVQIGSALTIERSDEAPTTPVEIGTALVFES